jgi:hypothetical protein
MYKLASCESVLCEKKNRPILGGKSPNSEQVKKRKHTYKLTNRVFLSSVPLPRPSMATSKGAACPSPPWACACARPAPSSRSPDTGAVGALFIRLSSYPARSGQRTAAFSFRRLGWEGDHRVRVLPLIGTRGARAACRISWGDVAAAGRHLQDGARRVPVGLPAQVDGVSIRPD